VWGYYFVEGGPSWRARKVSETSGQTNPTSYLLGTGTRPVFTTTSLPYTDLCNSTGWSSKWPWYILLTSSLCQHISHNGESKISVWDFLFPTWWQKNVAIQKGQVKQVEEKVLHPLQRSTADGVAVGHSISVVHLTHATRIICHNFWVYGLPITIAEITLCWCNVATRQYVYVTFVSLQYCSHVIPGPYVNVAPFGFYFVGV
jgi:hypothetical protein